MALQRGIPSSTGISTLHSSAISDTYMLFCNVFVLAGFLTKHYVHKTVLVDVMLALLLLALYNGQKAVRLKPGIPLCNMLW